MKDNKDLGSPVFWIIAVILGVTIFKQFDFENFQFKNPALGIIYTLTFIFSIYVIIKGRKKSHKEDQPKKPIL
ncbi:hypothetical protein AQ505_12140 [Pedobacter sp. PACM 27299]|uniref:hypothetical protein n=1 Tax=Pedobacter sp. PACM 27299 TaxID=1727164 RepID=UPI000705BCE6|nr:hypothetical protein [Pedobacter sp. PACM 27299]ALL06174.1 hypothetical protein AQ505_12140 [Pedobacter sp. PACM 27299]